MAASAWDGAAPGDPPIPSVDYTATCVRPRWEDLPSGVRVGVEAAAGASVERADEPPTSGFTGGFAAALHLSDGRRVFAKAGSSTNPHLTSAYRQEALVLAGLPAGCPAPRLVGAGHLAAGEVDEHEWRIVVAEAIDGVIPQPWTDAAVSAVNEACVQAAQALGPAAGSLGLELESMSQTYGADADIAGCFPALSDGTKPLTEGQPSWVLDRCQELTDLVARAASALAGDVPSHNDLRADNVLIDGRGRAVFVDWNWLQTGPAWIDFVGVLPLARAEGVDVDAWLRRSPLTRGVDRDDVDSWLAVIAAYMLDHADRPLWPGGPHLVRVHQRRYARCFLDWLGARRGWAA